ncbi:MAG: hypothetical protein AB1861_29085 [Cyanobacteriota bacterium]
MALLFSLSAEFGSSGEAAKVFANHFDNVSWVLSDGLQSRCSTRVFQDVEDNWWCMICPRGVSESGVGSPEDAHQMTELGLLLYQRLQSAPPFRYALVGIEVDEVRTYSELMTPEGQPDVPFDGLVLAEEIWNHIGRPVDFNYFKEGYLWKPYQGEVYSPLEVSTQLRQQLHNLLATSPSVER